MKNHSNMTDRVKVIDLELDEWENEEPLWASTVEPYELNYKKDVLEIDDDEDVEKQPTEIVTIEIKITRNMMNDLRMKADSEGTSVKQYVVDLIEKDIEE